MYLLLYMLLCTTAYIFCAENPPQPKIVPKKMPAGVRHLEELQDLRGSQELTEIEEELKSKLPRTPASRRDPVLLDPANEESIARAAEQQEEDPMRATIRKFYAELGMTVNFHDTIKCSDKDSPK